MLFDRILYVINSVFMKRWNIKAYIMHDLTSSCHISTKYYTYSSRLIRDCQYIYRLFVDSDVCFFVFDYEFNDFFTIIMPMVHYYIGL